LATVALTTLGFLAVRQMSDAIRSDMDDHLLEEAAEVVLALNGGLSLSTFAGDTPASSSLRIGIFDGTGQLLESAGAVPPPPGNDQRFGAPFNLLDPTTGDTFRAILLPASSGEGASVAVTAMSLSAVEQRISQARVRTVQLIMAAILALAVGSHVLTGMALRPIEGLRRDAEELATAPRGGRLSVPEPKDEVRRLAETLNTGLEAADLAAQTQRAFLAAASHELRTPIARLRADIDLARRPIRSRDEVAAALDSMDDHAVHLTALSDNLLATLAPQANLESRYETISIAEVLCRVRDRTPEHPDLSFAVPDESGSMAISTEPTGLVSAVSNLIDNSYRHGSPPVDVTVSFVDGWVQFEVRDHGPGIPLDMRDEVLVPFHRAVAATSGSGLGLSVVHHFALAHGGELAIEDGLPGCRMVLRIPASPVGADVS
jgi:signal transduction histidine kinase